VSSAADLRTTKRLPRPKNSDGERASAIALARSERRDRVRCEVYIDIDGSTGQGTFAGVTHDLSEAGTFIATELDRPVGTLVQLHLHLAGDTEPLRCVGEVRWKRGAGQGSDAPPGMGLRFVLLEPESRHAIQRFLSQLSPLDDL
jgi:uncharacterized protein (TIGR02266 family)